jgi:hypothetical protein
MQIHDTPSLRVRFWSKVNRNGPVPAHRPELGPCWVWTAGLTDGYGQFQVRIVGGGWMPVGAHRVSYALAHDGCLLIGPVICHACDYRPCVRPDHLFEGTRLDNVADAVAKSRHCHGVRRPFAKLTEDDVRAIRAIPPGTVSQSEIARRYSISRSVIEHIRLGKAWKHVQ